MNEYGRAWTASRDRVSALILATSLDQLEAIAPLTPEWRIRDILAHLTGAAEDIVGGNFPQDFDAWTSAQVERLRETDAHTLVEMWSEFAVADMLSEPLGIVLYDQVTHEADIFHALSVPTNIDDETMDLLIGFTLNRFAAKRNDLAVTLQLEGQTWQTGDGAKSLSLTASRFEWFRASNGRRSANQIRSMAWAGDVDYMEILFGSRFFVPASDDISEVAS